MDDLTEQAKPTSNIDLTHKQVATRNTAATNDMLQQFQQASHTLGTKFGIPPEKVTMQMFLDSLTGPPKKP